VRVEEHEAARPEDGGRLRDLPRVIELGSRHHDVRAVALGDDTDAVEAGLVVEPLAVVREPASVLEADREAHPARVVGVGKVESRQHRLRLGPRREHLRGVDDAVFPLEGRHGEPVPLEGLVHLDLAHPVRRDPVGLTQETTDLGRADEHHARGLHERGHVLDVVEVAVRHEAQTGVGERRRSGVRPAERVRPVRIEDQAAAGRGQREARPAVVDELHLPSSPLNALAGARAPGAHGPLH
jgi:hypothetical protein